MADMDNTMPSVKRARISDTSVSVHGAEASAPAEQQTNGAAASSQQRAVQDIFGTSHIRIPARSDKQAFGNRIDICLYIVT